MAQLDMAGVYTGTAGTGTLSLGSAIPGLLTLSSVGAVDGTTYDYSILAANGTDREVGYGTYTASGPTLTRNLVKSTTGSLLNLAGTSEVRITPRAASFFEGPASATDDHIAVYDGTTGKKVKGGGTTIAALTASILSTVRDGVSASFDTLAEIATSLGGKLTASNNLSDVGASATAFNNIKQAASDTVTGVVELATSAEVATGTDSARAVTPAGAAAVYSPTTRQTNAQTGTNYTFVLSDAGKLVTLANGSAITATVPPNSSVAFPVNTQIDLAALGAGQVSLAQGAGVTINSEDSKKKLTKQYSGGTLLKTATDTWLLVGSLTT